MVCKRITAASSAILVLVAVLAACGCGTGTKEPAVKLEKVSGFEGGRLYAAGKIFVAQLNGGYKEMGRQYGGLMTKQMKQFYDEAVDGFFSSHPQLPRGQVEEALESSYTIYPARIRQIFEGMKETSGLTIDQLVVMDNALVLPIMAGEMAGCSMAAVWKDYTGDGPLVYARSFDYAPSFQGYNDTLTVVVYNPDDGSRSVAALVNAGQVGTTSALNEEMLVLAMNVGTISGGQDMLTDIMPTLLSNLTFMFDASNLHTLVAELKTVRPVFAVNLNVADEDEACSMEETTTQYRQRNGSPGGLLVSTNHFLEPTWNLPAPVTQGPMAHELWQNTITRYDNLVSQCEKDKGKLDAEAMMKIFDLPIDKGGPVQPDTTIYEFVTVPEELQLWVKAYGYQDWVLVDLAALFN